MYKDISIKFVIAETLFFFLVFSIIGFHLRPKDPLFIKTPISPFLVFVSVFTLYYGFLAGLVIAVFSGLAFYKLYPSFPTSYFLWELLILLVASEFNYYWTNNVAIAKEESRYFKEKLREQTSEFVLLKLSHDQLENQYLLKPMTIRNVLKTIKEKAIKNGMDVIPEFLNLLSQAFGIESASLYLKENKDFKKVGDLGKGISLNKDDPMVSRTIETQEASFISSFNGKANYLAVVPLIVSDEVEGLFLIESMPFTNLNSDNMLSITVACNWLLREIKSAGIVGDLIKRFPNLSGEFLKELKICQDLYLRFGIESAVVALFLPAEKEDLLSNFFDEGIRGIDMICKVDTDKGFVVLTLLPLSSLSVAKGFIERIRRQMTEMFGAEFLEEVKHILFKVNKKVEANIRNILDVRE